jgi:hypothetical protein
VEIRIPYGPREYTLRISLPERQVILAQSANPAPVRSWEEITRAALAEPIGTSRLRDHDLRGKRTAVSRTTRLMRRTLNIAVNRRHEPFKGFAGHFLAAHRAGIAWGTGRFGALQLAAARISPSSRLDPRPPPAHAAGSTTQRSALATAVR